MLETYNINIASALCHLKETINTLLIQVKKRNPYIRNDDYMDLRLIFSELLVNAMTHGNRLDIRKKVYITIELTDDSVISKIIDEGNGFNYNEVLNSKKSNNDFLADTGRGIMLVRMLTDELTFNKIGNEIKFVKRFSCVQDSQKP